MFTRIDYELRILTEEPPKRVALLERNLVRHGTVYNTLAAACAVDGRVIGVAPATQPEERAPGEASRQSLEVLERRPQSLDRQASGLLELSHPLGGPVQLPAPAKRTEELSALRRALAAVEVRMAALTHAVLGVGGELARAGSRERFAGAVACALCAPQRVSATGVGADRRIASAPGAWSERSALCQGRRARRGRQRQGQFSSKHAEEGALSRASESAWPSRRPAGSDRAAPVRSRPCLRSRPR